MVEPPPSNVPPGGLHSSCTSTSQASTGEAKSGVEEAMPTLTTSLQSLHPLLSLLACLLSSSSRSLLSCHMLKWPKEAIPLLLWTTMPGHHQPVTNLLTAKPISGHPSRHIIVPIVSLWDGQATQSPSLQTPCKTSSTPSRNTSISLQYMCGFEAHWHTCHEIRECHHLHESSSYGITATWGYPIRLPITAGNDILDFTCPDNIMPEVELDVPWYGAVIHNILAHPLQESYQGIEAIENLWEIVTIETGLMGKDIRDLHILHWDEDLDKWDQLSIRVMLADPLLHEHFCHDDAFLFGMHCHISCYHPRKWHQHCQWTPNSSSLWPTNPTNPTQKLPVWSDLCYPSPLHLCSKPSSNDTPY